MTIVYGRVGVFLLAFLWVIEDVQLDGGIWMDVPLSLSVAALERSVFCGS